jgi:dolichol-phosphate mannosyltransferase
MGASIYVRLITGLPVKDATAGFVGYKASALSKLELNALSFVGYAFQIEMKFKLWKKGCSLKEIPIVFVNREKGVSKMNSSIIWEAIYGVIYLKFESIYKHR